MKIQEFNPCSQISKAIRYLKPNKLEDLVPLGIMCATLPFSPNSSLVVGASYVGYKLLSWKWEAKPIISETASPSPLKSNTIKDKLQTELFKRLPSALKEEILLKVQSGGISDTELTRLNNPSKWNNRIEIRKIAIQACLEGKISEKRLSFIMLYCMAREASMFFPGMRFSISTKMDQETVKGLVNRLCDSKEINRDKFTTALGNLSSDEDAFLIVDMEPLNPNLPYQHTAELSRTLYPFSTEENGSTTKKLFVFQPHILENVLSALYPECPEKPLFVLGTRKIEKFSDNEKRVLSMTGGTTIPTPNIEANEAKSLPFYLHDSYHIAIDSAMGYDRIFWNGFGKYLQNFSKTHANLDMQCALHTLSEFCLDKEFEYYLLLPKELAFPIPLLGMWEIAGQKETDDSNHPFQPINADIAFPGQVRERFLECLLEYWEKELPKLPIIGESLKSRNIKGALPLLKSKLKVPQGLEQTLLRIYTPST